MARGVVAAGRIPRCCPVADGGEGTLDVLLAIHAGDRCVVTVHDASGRPARAAYGIINGDTAVVELAQASGLVAIPASRRNPEVMTSFGTGELIRHALERGCRRVIVGLGGSATCDGGVGLAQALGVRFEDDAGRPLPAPLTGGDLARIAGVDTAHRPRGVEIIAACDVRHELLGPAGAAAIFAPQKGASPDGVERLADGLASLARVAGGAPAAPGAGAAGGAAYGLATFLGATLRPGSDVVLDAVRFDERLDGATLVLTGEGRLDETSRYGKAALAVAGRARRRGIPVIAIVGQTGPGWASCIGEGGLEEVHTLVDRFGAERAWAEAAVCVEATARNLLA